MDHNAQKLISFFEKNSVEFVFGLPGEENLHILEALANSKIKTVITHHEEAAGFMAANSSRFGNGMGVCFSTLGPGATNLTTSIAYAKLCQLPTFFVVAQKSNLHGQKSIDPFQHIDLKKLFKPLCKDLHQLTVEDDLNIVVDNLKTKALSSAKGPVILIIPENLQDETSNAEDPFENTQKTDEQLGVKSSPIDDLRQRINRSEKPMVIIGGHDLGEPYYRKILQICELTHIPFLTTQMGKGLIKTQSTNFKACLVVGEDDCANRFLNDSDLNIFIGCQIPETPLMTTFQNSDQFVFIDEAQGPFYIDSKNLYIGDLSNIFESLSKLKAKDKSWIDSMQTVKSHASVLSYPESPESIVENISNFSNSKTLICLDNGLYKLFFSRNLPVQSRHGLVLDNALATMGAGIPSAISAKLHLPDRDVLAVTGDGGLMMSFAEIETAKRSGLDLSILVLIDNSYGMIKWKQSNEGFPSFGMDFTCPNLESLSNAFDVTYIDTKTTGLENSLKKASETSGVKILSAKIDYSKVSSNLPDAFRAKFS